MVCGFALLPEIDDPLPAISHFSDGYWIVGRVCHSHLIHSAHLTQVHCSDQRTHIRLGCRSVGCRLWITPLLWTCNSPEKLRKKPIFQFHLQNAINISDFKGIAHWEKIVSEKYYFQVINHDISYLPFTPVFWHHMTGLFINQFIFLQTIKDLINVLIWIRDHIQNHIQKTNSIKSNFLLFGAWNLLSKVFMKSQNVAKYKIVYRSFLLCRSM